MKKYLFIFILFYISLASFVYAEVPVTTGFIPGQIWYSKEPLVEGDKVLIHTAIWNGDSNSLSAKVTFYDKNVVLGTRDVIVPSGTIKEANVSWQVTAGDHSISAKIVSSSLTTNNKKETVVLDRSSTSEDHKFISVVLKNSDGTKASSSDIVNSQIDTVSSTVNSVIPESVSTPVSKGLGSLDTFRDDTYTKINSSLSDAKKVIDSLNNTNTSTVKDTTVKNTTKVKTLPSVEEKKDDPLSKIDKPIAYIKLFFLSVLSFIFGYKIIFYGLISVLIFIVIRFLYRKIKNR